MKKVIISMAGCQKCNQLKSMNPDAEAVELSADKLLSFAREVGITAMPFVVVTGEVNELDKIMKE